MSLSPYEIEGYFLADFQCKNKEHLDSKDVKVILPFYVELSAREGSGIPDIAIRGLGWRFTPRTNKPPRNLSDQDKKKKM